MPGVRTLYSSTIRLVSSWAPLMSSQKPFALGAWVTWPRMRFSQSGRLRRRRRRGDAWRWPSLPRLRVAHPVISSPRNVWLPRAAALRPISASISSV